MSKKSLYSVRKRRKTRHPQIIVDANRTKFKSVTLTHSKTKDKKYPTKTNVELPDNPDLNDDRVSYFARRIITDLSILLKPLIADLYNANTTQTFPLQK